MKRDTVNNVCNELVIIKKEIIITSTYSIGKCVSGKYRPFFPVGIMLELPMNMLPQTIDIAARQFDG